MWEREEKEEVRLRFSHPGFGHTKHDLFRFKAYRRGDYGGSTHAEKVKRLGR